MLDLSWEYVSDNYFQYKSVSKTKISDDPLRKKKSRKRINLGRRFLCPHFWLFNWRWDDTKSAWFADKLNV